YLRYPDGDAAAEWLTRVLGFGPARSVRGPDGSWAEGGVVVGPAHVDICGGHEPAGQGAGALLIIGVSDVDAQYERIRTAGVELAPPRDGDYGPRPCQVSDPWGYEWYFGRGAAISPE